jgi:hypothetical protein
MDEPRDVVSQITEYLSNGGLFNPELMPHFHVRDLLMACRDEIIAARACAEMMLQGTGQAQCEALLDRVIEANYPTRWISVDEQIPEEAKEVLAYADGRRCNAEFWRSEWWHACQGFEKRGGRMLKRVTHWMPLPEPPEVK